jgi:thioredoxin-related protein
LNEEITGGETVKIIASNRYPDPPFIRTTMTRLSWTKNMLGALLLSLALTVAINAPAQSAKVPAFKMMLGNGKIFRAQDLPIGKPIIIIYFDPDCDHCEKMIKELQGNTTELSKASIAMVTYVTVNDVVQFEKKFALVKQQNFYVGTEGDTYFLKNYYRLTNMPFLALYTKNGDLVKEYRNEGAIPDLVNQLKKLP